MKIAVVGSRDYPRLDLVRDAVKNFPAGSTLVSGGARGVDKVAEEAADVYGFKKQIFQAHWRKGGVYNPRAGFERNPLIINAADKVLAFYDGESRGTMHSVKLALAAKKPLVIVGPDGEPMAKADYE